MKPQKLTIVLAAGLFLSLSVNFFLAGLMIGDAVTPAAPAAAQGNTPAPEARPDRRAEWQKREQELHAALNEADRAVMLTIKQKYDPLFNSLRADLEQARGKVAGAMEAEPIDEAVLDDAIATEAAIKSRILQEMTAARIETMGQLSPEGRQLLRKMMPARRGFGRGEPAPDAPRPPPHAAVPEGATQSAPALPDAQGAPDMPPEVRDDLQLPSMPQPEAP